MADREISDADLLSLLEAARWAASSRNEQPWSYIVAKRSNAEEFAKVLSCLVDANQVWARHASVLAIGCYATTHARNGEPNLAAPHDLGAASASLTFEATSRGLLVHQMIGIHPERARELFAIPAGIEPLTAIAIGYEGDPNSLPEHQRQRDLAPRTRKPLSEFVFSGRWGDRAPL
ncbi:nitroreductase family protein [Lacipirellula sp.]|uniref:nitroreductase family protein n=1 Tax=Lacipirellula sp. TaxID=2691419 RepID=UPI003D147BF5